MSNDEMSSDEAAQACADVMWSQDAASQHLGMKILEVKSGLAVLSMPVTPHMVNGWDICHGAYVSAVADSAFAFACNTHGFVTVAAGFDINFLRPAHLGDLLVARAVERFRTRNGIYDVTVRRGLGESTEVVAEFRGRSHMTKRPILGAEAQPPESTP
jgi:acyl-CoA thioesterase